MSHKTVLPMSAILALVLCLSACGPELHIRRLHDDRRGALRVDDVNALAEYPRDARAARAVVQALDATDAAVRFFAADALRRFRWTQFDRADRQLALRKLVARLDDGAFGAYTVWLWPLLPVGGRARVGSVRARALLTLTALTGRDFGLDKAEWLKWLDDVDRERAGR